MKYKNPHPSSLSLFEEEISQEASHEDLSAPLAVRVRPKGLENVVGQEHLLGEGRLLRRTLQSGRWTSMIFYGPPGSGKTTLALIISRMTQSRFVRLNAVAANVSDLRQVISEAQELKRKTGQRTIVFIDEIHRFNRAQQDVLMPDVEDGTLILIGATTQNPSFAINGPLLSRSTIFELTPLEEEELKRILRHALETDKNFQGKKIEITEEAMEHLVKSAAGDARRALTALEIGILTTPPDDKGVIHFDVKVAEESCQRKVVYYDADGDYHYDSASAFIKSMRGSDPDAAIYWLAKMLYAGEDPRFIIRRIIILASEDIGNADPQALILASAGLNAIEFVGLPEARIILAQLVTYMALAPKSNASYVAIEEALSDVKKEAIQEVPNHLRDKSYQGAKRLKHGENYIYPHNHPQAAREQTYLKKPVRQYYRPIANSLPG